MINRQELVFPGLFLLGLAVVVVLVLSSSKRRGRFSWGRGTNIPISVSGAAGIVLAFLMMSGALLAGALGWLTDGFFVLIGLLSGFVVFILAGSWDSWKHARKVSPPGAHRTGKKGGLGPKT